MIVTLIIIIAYLIISEILGFIVIMFTNKQLLDILFDRNCQKQHGLCLRDSIIIISIAHILFLPWAIGYWFCRAY